MRTASDIIAEIAYDAYWDDLVDADGKNRRSDRRITDENFRINQRKTHELRKKKQ